MLFRFILPFLAALSVALAAPTGRYGKSVRGDESEVLPLRWVTEFGSTVVAGSTLDLHWEGGSGSGYEVYYVPQWPGQKDYQLLPILTDTTDRYIGWRVPPLDQYPEDTTFIIGVKDLYSTTSGYYDLTPIMKFVS